MVQYTPEPVMECINAVDLKAAPLKGGGDALSPASAGGGCVVRDETSWRAFREQLLEALEANEWSDSRAPDTAATIVEMVQQALAATACSVYVSNGNGHRMFFDQGDGDAAAAIDQGHRSTLSVPAEWVLRHQSPLMLNAPDDYRHIVGGDEALLQARTRVLCVPLMAGNRILGVMEVTRRGEADPFSDRDLATARVIGTTAGMAIENSTLRRSIEEGYRSTIRALASAIDAKDPYTCGHSQRVAQYSMICGLALNLDADRMHTLETAAILHDIGKIGIDDAILRKPRKLSPTEQAIVRDHPVIGAAIVHDVGALHEEVELILHHHEYFDGSGYPHGLKGNDIPWGARIIAVGDAFDSMTTERPYRRAMTINEAMRELLRCRGTQFCPEALDAFAVGFTRYYDDLPRPPLARDHAGRVPIAAA